MAKYLTDEWMDMAKQEAQSFPEKPGATAKMQYVVTGAPDDLANAEAEGGKAIEYYMTIDNGKVLEQARGKLDDAEVTLTQSWEDSVKVQKGELDANAAFMQGRVKVGGNMAKVMSLLPLTQSPEYKDIQERVRQNTEY